MREIKFRALLKNQHFKGWEYFDLLDSLAVRDDFDRDTICQYTGLKDKNGVEIYESDYLGDWCVFWGSGKYILQNISTGDIIDCNQITTYDEEITGNKYESPREHKAMETDL